jgi:hypothetical protein
VSRLRKRQFVRRTHWSASPQHPSKEIAMSKSMLRYARVAAAPMASGVSEMVRYSGVVVGFAVLGSHVRSDFIERLGASQHIGVRRDWADPTYCRRRLVRHARRHCAAGDIASPGYAKPRRRVSGDLDCSLHTSADAEALLAAKHIRRRGQSARKPSSERLPHMWLSRSRL